MDADLAYCLERFIDDQVQMIDDYMETVREEEAAEHRRIEKEKKSHMLRNKNQINEGSHETDEAIVRRFVQRLHDSTNTNSTAVDSGAENYRQILRDELYEKMDKCANHIIRMRNLAVPIRGSDDFIWQCDNIIDRLDQEQNTDESFKQLYQIIEQSNRKSLIKNVQKWWEKSYGSYVMEIIHLNKKFNPRVANNNIAVVSSWSRFIQCAKKVHSTRTAEIPAGSRKNELVREFVKEIQSVDNENRQEISEDDLVKQLDGSDISTPINYAETWLNKRDKNRNQKKADDTYDRLWQEAKAQFDRQCIAQEAKKLALANLLCRLAIGSANTEQFDQKLKKTLEKQKKGEGIPVVTGDIKEPEIEELPISIRTEGTDTKQWSKSSNRIQDEFSSSLCQAFGIPVANIRITKIDHDTGIIYAYVLPPYGKNVIDSLNGTASDSAARIEAVRKCCLLHKAVVESISLGDFDLSVDQKLMDPTWNREYVWSRSEGNDGQYWQKPIDRGGKPYFCPSGWKRFGVKVAENDKEFDDHWGDWYLAYHGTKSQYAVNILTSGLRVSTGGCFYEAGIPRVYVSPSIEYCAHPRYAKPWTKTEKNGKTRWFQLVFQCRVNPKAVETVAHETLLQKESKQVTIDPNFDNNELEWIIPGTKDIYYMKKDIICYGIMMRVSDVNPAQLPSSAWWKYVTHS